MTTKAQMVMDPVTNDGEEDIQSGVPFIASVVIQGVAPLLFHRWSNEAVASKAAAAKNSKAKKTDNVESYVYRTDAGNLALPGEYVRQSVIGASKFRQDPRSPRASAIKLFTAGVVSMTDLADLGVADWDYLDRRRVLVQRAAVTRERPALRTGWRASVDLMVLLPEYIDSTVLLETLGNAGRLIGIGDFRPTYGRFAVIGFEVGRG